jgi:hypothetical protein
MVTATATRLSCWDFVTDKSPSAKPSPVPRVKHVPYTYTPASDDDDDDDHPTNNAWDLCLVPANDTYKEAIREAVHAMVEGAGEGLFSDGEEEEEKKEERGGGGPDDPATGFPLGLTLEILLEFMEQARHPGLSSSSSTSGGASTGGKSSSRSTKKQSPSSSSSSSSIASELRYAGGKILCLLGNPPMEVVPSTEKYSVDRTSSQPPFHQGGVAGACFPHDTEDRWGVDPSKGRIKKGDKKSNKTQKKKGHDVDPTDLTPSNLKKYVTPLDPEDQLAVIGKRCARAALGVDLIVIVPENDDNRSHIMPTAPVPWYGMPLLRVLSDTSGAPGPLMFGSAYANDSDTETPSLLSLQENVLSRTPWQAGMVFGARLRLRISPGFELEDTPVERKRRLKLQLATFLSSGGLMGPAAVDDADSGLWIMGSCDPYTSFTVDLQAAKDVKDRFHVDGFGEVALRPVIQTCMLYTCIETDGAEKDPNYYTVCKMRVSSLSMTLAEEVEPIYDALDPEALAAILYHKIALDAYLEGFFSAQETAESWLKSLMVCVYQSAQVEQAKIEEQRVKRHQIHPASGVQTNFVAGERLLDQEGDLEVEEVLLGAGHSKMAVVPLLVYALMQCDALRPCGGNFQPSMDARVCAMAQIASMTPSTLAKVIAPSLILWSMKDDAPVMESLPLSRDGVVNALDGINDENDGVLLLDSPKQTMLCLSDHLFGETRSKKKNRKDTSKIAINIGPKLETTILACLKGSRTPPAHWKDLAAFLEGEEFKEVPPTAFQATLLEDKPTASGIRDFAEWKIEMASSIQEELKKSGDIVD